MGWVLKLLRHRELICLAFYGCVENLRSADCLSIVKVNSEPTTDFVRVTPPYSEITKKTCPFRRTMVLSSDNCDA